MVARLLVIPTVALALSATAALAQAPTQGPPPQGQGPAGMAQRRMQMMLQGITLTPAQQASVDSIQAAFTARMPAVTPGQRPDSASMAQRRELMTQQNDALRAVLTPDQQQVWDRNVEQMRSQMRRPG